MGDIAGALSIQEVRGVLDSLRDEMRPLVTGKAEVWQGQVVEVIGSTVRVARADEPTVAANLLRQPYPVVGPVPAVGDQVWAASWLGGGIVITGRDNLFITNTNIENPVTGSTLQAGHYYNISTAGASPTLVSGDLDPSTTTEATRIMVIRCTQDCTINAASGQTVNNTLTSFYMPAFSSVTLAARGSTGWAVIASSGVPAFSPSMAIFSCYRSTTFTFSAASTWTKLLYDVEQVDTGWLVVGTGATQSRFTPQIAGWYQFQAYVETTSTTDLKRYVLGVAKNGTTPPEGYMGNTNTSGTALHSVAGTSPLMLANGTTDYFEVFSWQNNSSSQQYNGGSNVFWWTGRLVLAT